MEKNLKNLIKTNSGTLFGLLGLVAISFAWGCGDDEPEPVACVEVDGDAFDTPSGWEIESYAPTTTPAGCYPFHAEAGAEFGSFVSMRTSSTGADRIATCGGVLSTLNCGTYRNETMEFTFHVESEDRLTMRALGEIDGRSFDTRLYFNPCQNGCLGAVTLSTLEPDQQAICEIPSQVSQCLFDASAHTISFARVGDESITLRLAGGEHVLTR